MMLSKPVRVSAIATASAVLSAPLHASEASIQIPDLDAVAFPLFGDTLTGPALLMAGLVV